LLFPAGARAEVTAVSIADYSEYRAALADVSRGPAPPVSFHDLWNAPDHYRGGRVEVVGRVARRFRQPAVGEFPALAEVWIVDDPGNPTCLVFPAGDDAATAPGRNVRFTGTFLRLIRYDAQDSARLAPLIVGAGAPLVDEIEISPTMSSGSVDWAVGLGLLVLVLVILGAQHLRARPRRRHEIGPMPSFREPNDGAPPIEGQPGDGTDVH
jgi:hypothetical protein